MTASPNHESRYSAAFVCALILFVLIAIAVKWRLQPISAKGVHAPATEFSAGRALSVLSNILGDERPHPVDSGAAADVRQRIVDQLQRLNYQVEVQDTTSCRRFEIQTCARVRNPIATHRGTADGKSVLLSAHYDSVPAGPGASDDGSGVAILLEIAGLLKNVRRPETR